MVFGERDKEEQFAVLAGRLDELSDGDEVKFSEIIVAGGDEV